MLLSLTVSVGQFFELLGKVLHNRPFTPDRIYICDKTGTKSTAVPKLRSKLIAATDKKQLGALTSAEQVTTITIEVSV